MNPDRVYLVIALVIAVVVLANAMMFAMVRGSRGAKMDWLHSTKDTLRQPFKHEDDALDELRKRVDELPEPQSGPDDDNAAS
ncbi:MAG: hypothetical protein GXP40_04715 [Chloroflexi bacterium]|nr:hypothetical protein [Chloroflexota bacterium]